MQYVHGAPEGDKRIEDERASKYNHSIYTLFSVSLYVE